MLKETHHLEENYTMKLELLLLALHIHENRHHHSDDIIDLLNNFLRDSSCTDFKAAMNTADSHVKSVLFCDLEVDARLADHEDSSSRLNEVLRRLIWLAGDVEFKLHDPSTRSMRWSSLTKVLESVNDTRASKGYPRSVPFLRLGMNLTFSYSAQLELGADQMRRSSHGTSRGR